MSRAHRIELDARLVALGVGLLFALAALAGTLAWRSGQATPPPTDGVLRQELLDELAGRSSGDLDSHPDGTIGHVHLRGQRESFHGPLFVNSRGMREVEYELPKPPGTMRIIILGDSFVFGWRVAAEERMGAYLEQYLRERGAESQPLEVLHLAVVSWNLPGECAFVLRQLEALAPDLVVQFTVSNDLDDSQGVRGFGTLGNFPTQGLGPGNSLLYVGHTKNVLGVDLPNYLSRGYGFDSLTRFAESRTWLEALRAGLSRLPGKPHHLLVVNWNFTNPHFHDSLGSELAPDSLFYLPTTFWDREEYHVAPDDRHWNPAGHRAVARLLYGLIRERELLPLPHLEAWPEAEQETREYGATGWEEIERGLRLPVGLKPSVEPMDLDRGTACQILGGIDRDGLVAPYASVLLRKEEGAMELHLAGRFLPESFLAEEEVILYADEFELGRLVVDPGQPFDFRAPLAPEILAREAACARFLAQNFVYRGTDQRQCAVFRLERVAFE